MKRVSVVLLAVSVLAVGCGKSSTSTDPSKKKASAKTTPSALNDLRAKLPQAAAPDETLATIVLALGDQYQPMAASNHTQFMWDNGCDVAEDFSVWTGNGDLPASVGLYCNSLKNQGKAVDCSSATAYAGLISTNIKSAMSICSGKGDRQSAAMFVDQLLANIATMKMSLGL